MHDDIDDLESKRCPQYLGKPRRESQIPGTAVLSRIRNSVNLNDISIGSLFSAPSLGNSGAYPQDDLNTGEYNSNMWDSVHDLESQSLPYPPRNESLAYTRNHDMLHAKNTDILTPTPTRSSTPYQAHFSHVKRIFYNFAFSRSSGQDPSSAQLFDIPLSDLTSSPTASEDSNIDIDPLNVSQSASSFGFELDPLQTPPLTPDTIISPSLHSKTDSGCHIPEEFHVRSRVAGNTNTDKMDHSRNYLEIKEGKKPERSAVYICSLSRCVSKV